MTIKNIGIAILVLAALSGVASFFGVHSSSFGSSGNAAETYYNSQWLVGGNQIGPTGTLNANSQFGTCNITGGAAGIAASSTSSFDCAVAGVVKGDTVLGDPGVNAPAGFFVTKVVASTTANGFIEFSIYNAGAASSTLGVALTNGMEYVTWR